MVWGCYQWCCAHGYTNTTLIHLRFSQQVWEEASARISHDCLSIGDSQIISQRVWRNPFSFRFLFLIPKHVTHIHDTHSAALALGQGTLCSQMPVWLMITLRGNNNAQCPSLRTLILCGFCCMNEQRRGSLGSEGFWRNVGNSCTVRSLEGSQALRMCFSWDTGCTRQISAQRDLPALCPESVPLSVRS